MPPSASPYPDTPLESRTRMVSFRLTIEEYERLRQLTCTRSLRNVSELVRAAVNRMLTEPGTPLPPTYESRLSHLEERVQSLAVLVESLRQSDAAPLPQPIRQAAAS